MPRREIPESFLGYLVGLIDADVRFSLDREGLLAVLPEFRGRSGDPFQLMKKVSRGPVPSSEGGTPSAGGTPTSEGTSAALGFAFPGDQVIPIPLGLFGYHPITVSVSRQVLMAERRLPSRIVGSMARGAEFLSHDYEYRLFQGHASFHFDDWLVVVSGGFLEDFSVEGLAIFQDRGEWRALVAGRGASRPVVCWLFDLRHMSLILRVPGPLLDLAAELAS